jgi:hypothetical protein
MTIEAVTGSTASASLLASLRDRLGAGAAEGPDYAAKGRDYAARAVRRTVWPCSQWRTISLASGVSRRRGRHSSQTRW